MIKRVLKLTEELLKDDFQQVVEFSDGMAYMDTFDPNMKPLPRLKRMPVGYTPLSKGDVLAEDGNNVYLNGVKLE